MKPVLVIAAVQQEICLLEEALEHKITPAGAIPHYSGRIGNQQLVVCAGGVGKINAAIATSTLIERYQPQLVINTGCAGAYAGSGLAIGDLALASEEVLGDEGVITPSGWLDLQDMNLPVAKQVQEPVYNRLPLSAHYAQKTVELASKLDIRLTCGSFITVSTCSGTDQRGEELVQRFHAIAETMEGAAVALASLRYGVACLEIRGISNLVEDRNLSAWNMPLAMHAAQQFVLKLSPTLS